MKGVVNAYRQIKAYVSSVTYQRIKRFCNLHEVTIAELIRISLQDYIYNYERKDLLNEITKDSK